MKRWCVKPLGLAVPLLCAPSLAGQERPEIYAKLCLTVTRDSGIPSTTSPDPDETRNIFEFSLRTSQVGVRWNPAPVEDWTVEGRLEFDLQGGAVGTLQPRIRHGYFAFARDRWEVLAGQTWDVIAPLRADSISFPAESWPGDIGQRRPLVRATYKAALGAPASVSFVLGLGQFTQGLEKPGTGQVVDSAHVPAVMGRITAEFPFAGAMAQASVWGHSGQKGYGAYDAVPAGTLETSSVGTSLLLPLGPRWSFRAEVWQGKVGDAAYEPGDARGNVTLADVIESRGGWGQVAFKPSAAWRFNLGMGRQYPRSLRAAEQGAQRISSWYLNAYRTLAKRFEVGAELSDWDSRFPGSARSNKSFRGQVSLSCTF